MMVDQSRPHLEGHLTNGTKHTAAKNLLPRFWERIQRLAQRPVEVKEVLSRALPPSPRADFISCSMVANKWAEVDGTVFSRFSDSLAHLAGPDLSVVDADVFMLWEEAARERPFRTTLLDGLLLESFLKSKAARVHSGKKARWAQDHEKLLHGARAFPDLSFPGADAVFQRAAFIRALDERLQRWLGRIKPRAVLLGCFYNDLNMALSSACRALGIPCVDVQHGRQGPHHYMYSHWQAPPQEGYALLPSHFWTWGESSRATIAAWTDHTSGHSAFVGGNPWVAFKKESTTRAKPLPQALLDAAAKAKRVALISLWPIPEFFTDALAQAMCREKETLWLVRPHQAMADDLPAIKAKLKSFGVHHGFVEAVATADLFALFRIADVHITYGSTVAYEALAFGLPTIVVHEVGAEAMADHIRAGHFIYADDATSLLDAIHHGKFVPEPPEKAFIQANPAVIRGALSDLTR
jgi:hypothetical protein